MLQKSEKDSFAQRRKPARHGNPAMQEVSSRWQQLHSAFAPWQAESGWSWILDSSLLSLAPFSLCDTPS
jgi:hypothetical protein